MEKEKWNRNGMNMKWESPSGKIENERGIKGKGKEEEYGIMAPCLARRGGPLRSSGGVVVFLMIIYINKIVYMEKQPLHHRKAAVPLS
ncbi:hypothetical protein LJC57_07825 [Parabacteroides sp. OttesenSCG-928-G07]|nr:hypothetical protein [Parabacteroides sp. OttesenSCG-928-G07]